MQTPRKVGSWVLGEQAATTTRLMFWAFIASTISAWVLPAQEKRWLWVYTTLGRVRAYSTTAGTSTTPAMLLPQWQMKTPTRGSATSVIASTSRGSGQVRSLR